jgi:hypothetical protein
MIMKVNPYPNPCYEAFYQASWTRLVDQAPELFYYANLAISNNSSLLTAWENYFPVKSGESYEWAQSILHQSFVETLTAIATNDRPSLMISELARVAMLVGHETWDDIFDNIDDDYQKYKGQIRGLFASHLVDIKLGLANKAYLRSLK